MARRLPAGWLELRPGPRRSPGISLLLALVDKQKCLKLDRGSSAEAGVRGDGTRTEQKLQSLAQVAQRVQADPGAGSW